MTDLPASKLAELVAKAKAAVEADGHWNHPAHLDWKRAADPSTILALAEEILRRQAEETK